jgi:DNA-binding NtrC family response regulator
MAPVRALQTPIVLAQSERRVCTATADRLIADGIVVIEVASTDEALSYLESRSDIRLVITEIDMPGCLSGLDLARFVMRRWPNIGIIVLGWPVQPTQSLPQTVTFLPKPCSPSSVAEQVRAKLAISSRPA